MERCCNTEALYAEEARIERIEIEYEKALVRFHDGIEDDVRVATAAINAIKNWAEECGVSDEDINDAIQEIR